MNIIDFHVHVGRGSRKNLSTERLIELMDKYEIDKCVICPVDEFINVKNREGNDYIIELVQKYHKRFYGFAVSNPWFGRDSIDELKRALDKGLVGLKIHSILQGFMLCEDIVDPLLQVASEYGIPVYAHTGTMGNALPFQLLELAERHKAINFIMGHMGHSDFWYDVIPVMERAENIYAETSHAGPDLIKSLIEKLGIDRVVFGSDIPESKLSVEVNKIKLLDLSAEQRECLFVSNAETLLGSRK
ncbi:MAG: amidohydrolase family protein [Spirochaetales bacterium]|nr:amidohydrolase family protein [Spirochaetales bacterium]